jgi:hypothetical protein
MNRLTGVILLLGMAASLSAQQLTLGTVSLDPGQTASLSLQLTTGGAQIAGLQYDLIYDPNTFTITASAGPAATAAGKTISTNSVQPNDLRVIVTAVNQTTISDGDVTDLSIQVAPHAAAANYPLAFSGVVGTTPGATAVSLGATNGAINVAPALRFYPLTPCRVADTRSFAGFTGRSGPPYMAAKTTRSFPVQSSACGVPSNAIAYSLNVTVVPRTGYLGFITTWGTGQPEPVASTLNSWNGTVVANAAIVPAGTNGEISIYASDDTDVFFDIDGYFAPSVTTGLQFYPLTPCRVADTRAGTGFTGPSGPPYMTGKTARSFPVQSSACGVPSNAITYSLNVTVVPRKGYLGFITTWGTGQPEPVASTLNSWTGTVVANAAIVPAGTNGEISIYASDDTDVFFDINGYFAPPSQTGFNYYAMTPCRVADTRTFAGMTGAFGPPFMDAKTTRSFPVPSSVCGVPAAATAYSLNVTVAPRMGYLGFLTTWGTGQPEPVASTLNSWDGQVRANAALVPAGTSGAISIYVSDATDLFFDISGYFGPGQ